MKTLLYAIVLTLLPCAAAWANCNPLPALDGGGVSTNMATATNGSSQCFFFYGLVDSTGANAIPAVTALADGMTNPTTFVSASDTMAYNGTTWDRVLNGHGTAAKSMRVELPTDGTGVVGLNAGANIVGKVGIDQTTPGTTNGVSLANIGATTVATGNGTSGAGNARHNIASDNSAIANWGHVATGAAPPSGATYVATNSGGATGGHVAGLITCNSHIFKHITTATDTLAVQGVASQTIYLCGWRSRAAGVATWFLENTASVNANCSSTLTQLNGVATEMANSGETMLAPFWTGLSNTSGNGLCINSTGTGGVDVDIWYAQF
jgi:hypothetical protein